jgi:hypothetical protein
MKSFAAGLKTKLRKLKVLSLVKMIQIYVDDLNCVTNCLPWGTRFVGGKLLVPPVPPGQTESDHQQETHTHDDHQRQTAALFREVANTVLPDSVKMKEDTCPDHQTGRIPILDTEMWVEEGMIRHNHYSKPISSTEVILARSAMSSTTKRNILVQEGTRRLKNCHQSLTWETMVGHMNTLMISMSEAGHRTEFRRVVAGRILANYKVIIDNDVKGTKKMYRNKTERKIQKEEGGATNKSTWFRGGGYTATYSVPATRDSALVLSTRKALLTTPGPSHTKVKVVEKPGAPILSGLTRSNPFPRETCGRAKCPLSWMKGGCSEKCFQENITYQAHCRRCRQEQLDNGIPLKKVKDQVYEGESARSLYTRSAQHIYDYTKEAVKYQKAPGPRAPPVQPQQDGQVEEECGSSFMWDHSLEAHQGQVSGDPSQDYQFRITGQFKEPLTRLLSEATRIIFGRIGKSTEDRGQGTVITVGAILNRKGGHFAPRRRFN